MFITRKIPEQALQIIKKECDFRIWDQEDEPVPYHILEKEIEHVDGLYCLLTDNIDAPLLQKAKHLKVISQMAVGYNNINIDYATERNVMVTNTPGVLTETTADLTFALMMATSRRLVEAIDYLKQGCWKTWSPMQLTGKDIFGATLGIVGLGRIGEAVARRAKGFNMNIVYYNRSRKADTEKQLGVIYKPLDELLAEADFVCVLVPYTQQTHHLISHRELQLMKPTSILINVARGGIVDEQALYEALTTGQLLAAGLDVFEDEPVPLNHPLLSLKNVVALPHIGSASIETRTRMAVMAAQNLTTALKNERPPHLVNSTRFK